MPRRYAAEFRRKVLDLVELVAARKRIAEPENELAIHRLATALLGEVVPPKDGTRPSL